MAIRRIKAFFEFEAAGGIVLALAAIAAMIIANSPLNVWYEGFIHAPVSIQIGEFAIAKDAHHWINDGLMAVFFFLVGLELKREVLIGELSNVKQIILPAGAALGGMIMPAIVYLLFNYNEPEFWKGWAIPAATDIAFALGILSLLGNRVPNSLKVFLVSIAIFDDIGAILIIALFYTSELSLESLAVAGLCLPFLYVLNRRNVTNITPYLLIGLIMWIAVLKSGIHATLAGVVLALFIPMFDRTDPEHSPLEELEHDLHNTVAFGILPIFAFANSGISLEGAGFAELFHSVPLGIAAGLFIGKQLGVMMMCWLIFKLGISTMPKGMDYKQIYGAALLCGVGFTMSLFIGGLAFAGDTTMFDERLGIIMGSIVSGIAGYIMLKMSLKDNASGTSVDLTRPH
ncbi:MULTISPECIES: Na+/H+ antiporter NhaA [Psychrobacter]|jgi:NhaA family Na+:H+ antiporter|uniref:Na+/H+ antiporter NhaA n=1 Tax=Psychrobacter TaxID=497 RepID=UPI0008698E91|nr:MULTISPECIES: Na+/H+ antiporter NhaA [Psychrobacter]MBA6244629.1 Na+/H+ antiporter NhaA [Psychrobacter sp. Urea-trap-18]MBA6285129.1 Na+/H+ antiporter NhaA [Psychrobacter sp. Urea-trap-16]MBA6319532.1 Na+/H+ antiporter NhaA [Psychrobacter sp. Urea-trap-20]MBA6334105.1 Na+/H+ antiporter NhaA [Psychrobacter sp. Urea-trap-19]OEH67454.1 MAG: Na(+)/H(+) antiporter NhaA [Psychrobacter sp. B29-1]|tara:strand:- start:60165 stop:61367 length:1203 start_codon:yes stop_codon:yes gene_type:complete